MVREVAAEHPATVQLDEFGNQLCPGGRFTTSFDGVQIRDGDGVHIVPTAAAGQWLDARVLPEALSVGRLQMAGRRLIPSVPVTTSASPDATTSASPSRSVAPASASRAPSTP
jgi:hypothetical protein